MPAPARRVRPVELFTHKFSTRAPASTSKRAPLQYYCSYRSNGFINKNKTQKKKTLTKKKKPLYAWNNKFNDEYYKKKINKLRNTIEMTGVVLNQLLAILSMISALYLHYHVQAFVGESASEFAFYGIHFWKNTLTDARKTECRTHFHHQ